MLIIVCGLQGSGKTTVALRIAKRLGADLLRTDVIRKELFRTPTYTGKEMQKVYDKMFSEARKLLREKRNVILDATFYQRENRNRAKEVAKEAKTPYKIVEVICAENIAKKRIERRSGDASTAKPKHRRKFKKAFEPIIEGRIIINNSWSLKGIDKQLKILL